MLINSDRSLFFSKGDINDKRLGDIVCKNVDEITSETKIAIIGCPQDIGVKRNGGRIGSSKAPFEIRKSFYKLTPFDVETELSIPEGLIVDFGNIDVTGSLEKIHERLQNSVEFAISKNLTPIIIGGGHDITYPSCKGISNKFENVSIINFDPHLDARPCNPLRNSGTSFRMLIEEGIINPKNVIVFGIQSGVNSENQYRWMKEQGVNLFTLPRIRKGGFDNTLSEALEIALSTNALYTTIDIDSIMSAFAPGVSASATDGFTPNEILGLSRELGSQRKVICLDIAEVNLVYESDLRTSRLASQIILHFVFGYLERDFLQNTI